MQCLRETFDYVYNTLYDFWCHIMVLEKLIVIFVKQMYLDVMARSYDIDIHRIIYVKMLH